MAKNITEQQLKVLQALIAGRTFKEIETELGVASRTAMRWKAKFAGLLSENDAAIATVILEARTESANLVVSALDELARLMRTSETTDEKLAVVDRVFRAYQILNPPQPIGSVSVSQANESASHGQVVVMLPNNGRDG